MADETELDLDTEDSINKTQKRITDLSTKVRDIATERDSERQAREAAEQKVAALEKEKEFYAGFTGMSGKYSGANEYAEDIKAKFNAGYTLEDATVAVLASNGKFGGSVAPIAQVAPPPPAPAAGGSASYTPPPSGDKSVRDMTRDEKRAALMEAEKRGDISLT